VERVRESLAMAHAAASVALDAWLEAPTVCIDSRSEPFLIQIATARRERERDHVDRSEASYVRHERGQRLLLELLDNGSRGLWTSDGWDSNSGKITRAGRAPNKFLALVYNDLRGGCGGKRVIWGLWGLERKLFGSIVLPWDTQYGYAHEVHIDPRVRAAVAELDRCLHDAWEHAARERAALGPTTEHQARFVAWIREQSRPVQHFEVKRWCAVERGRPANYNWGATDPAGPLLRRFCEKTGAPGTRATWVLRPEVGAGSYEDHSGHNGACGLVACREACA